MSWLTADDLEAFLQAGGLLEVPLSRTETLLDLAGAVSAAQERFEQEVRWFPFLKQNTDVTRYFDPNETCILDLQGGLMTLTSVSLAGVVQVENTDFFCMPKNAGARGVPITSLEFVSVPSGRRGSIAVAGRWGCVAALPDSVKQAVLGKAAVLLIPQIHAAYSRGLLRWREGDVEQSSGAEPFASLVQGWERGYAEAVRHYRRLVVA
jgi:hypothetical protein